VRRPSLRTRAGRLRRLTTPARPPALRTLAVSWWPILQQTAAATVAWLIARNVVEHPQPFFAPVAAVVGLNTDLGERGLNALRLLRGVVVGVVVGELAIAVLGGGYLSLGLATFTAMAIAKVTGGIRIVVAQAAVAAILVVATAQAEQGTQRLMDALIGTGVALLFSQLLFPPEPLRLVRRAETAALTGMAGGLASTARALDRDDDDEQAGQAMSMLRETAGPLAQLARMRRASTRVARHSLTWYSRRAPVVRENENAGHLDLLGASCVMLARTALAATPSQRRMLVPAVRGLADVLAELAPDPADQGVRQRAVDRTLELVRQLTSTTAEDALTEPVLALRLVATDTMVFAGVDAGQAAAAVRTGASGPLVADPAAPARKRSGSTGKRPSR
jgi:uncharacterized membrane protein YgaE (UPF0421/DUF939 family)